MNSELVFEQIKKIVMDEIGLSEDEILLNSGFTNDLGIDSLMLLDLIMKIEDSFKIIIPDKEAEKMSTIEDVVNYIAMHID